MTDICPKCRSPRVLLLTSFVCDCLKEGSTPPSAYHVGQRLGDDPAINAALDAGCCVLAVDSRSGRKAYIRKLGGTDVKWDRGLWVPAFFIATAKRTWSALYEFSVHQTQASEVPQ